MNTRSVMTIAAVVGRIFVAMGIFLVPAFIVELFGIGDSPSDIMMPRYFGLTLLAPGRIS